MRLPVATLTLCLSFVSPAFAECPGIIGEDVNTAFVDAFAKAAGKIGAPCAVSFTQTSPGQAVIKYLPEGEALDDWKTQMSVTVFTVEGKPGAETQAMANNFIGHVKKAGGEAEQLRRVAGALGPMLHVKYEIKEDSDTTRALAIIRPVGPDKVAAINWKRHDREPSEEDVKLFEDINGFNDVSEPMEEPKPKAKKPGPVAADAVKPEEAKPVEVAPVEVKPAEVKPAEAKPVEAKPVEPTPTVATSPAPAPVSPPPVATVKPADKPVAPKTSVEPPEAKAPEAKSPEPVPAQPAGEAK